MDLGLGQNLCIVLKLYSSQTVQKKSHQGAVNNVHPVEMPSISHLGVPL